MAKKENKTDSTGKAQLDEQKANRKQTIERAKKIQAARKAEEAKKAAEKKLALKQKKEEVKPTVAAPSENVTDTDVRPMPENEKKTINKQVKSMSAEDKKEPEYVDFAITARKYKTLLTNKYKNRKFWINPSPYEIQSYIPGTIIDICVKEGKTVQEGDPLLVLESMKMQNRIDMPFTAKIKKINVKVGERIPKDFLMVELEQA
ncbi:MAG: biotin/lipoyl attachment protein [Bacteroidetes bacterium]|nr:biotin/lipoyl attachment protein [Bacteroidota bacterium]